MGYCLADVDVKQTVKVVSLGAAGSVFRRKLLSMGVTPGIEINVTRKAPMGGPLELDYLRGIASEEDLSSPLVGNLLGIQECPSFHWLRQLKNTARWSGWRLPVDLFFPTTTLITTSDMICPTKSRAASTSANVGSSTISPPCVRPIRPVSIPR